MNVNIDLVALLIALFGGGLTLYYKQKADKAIAANIEAKTKVEDAPLSAKQKEIEDEIKKLEEQDDSQLTPDQRAKRWEK